MKTNIKLFLILFLFIFPFNTASAAYGSQCQTGQVSGPQNDCTHSNDQTILNTQCAQRYSSSSCTNMASYLNSMSVECSQINPSTLIVP